MPVRRVLFDAWHLEFFVPATAPSAAVHAIRRVLRGRAVRAAVRRAVLLAVRASPVCKPVTFTLHR